jgi:3-phenylpropionate/trans-cinnamate dioxygenase ferredoxin reductase subunit
VDVLVIGAGGAGSACAEALAEGGGSVLLVGRDVDPPYDRPYCSKEFMRGELQRAETYLHPAEWWAEQGVELLSRTSVTKLDAAAKTAKLSSGEEVAFGDAVLATGANVRRLRLDGGDLDGVHCLRTLGNSEAIRTDAEGAEHVLLIGGSFIACEVAASLTVKGSRCTMVMPEAAPLSLALGETAGRYFDGVLREHGVEVLAGEGVARLEGDGRVQRAVLESGREVAADVVVMGTGVTPDVMLARGAGLELGETGGVRCSSRLETSAPGVWAAGDSCEYASAVHGRAVRVEHWEVAKAQGAFAARAIRGESGDYREVPYFWSDLADWASLEYVGPHKDHDREVIRGSVDEGAFTIFYVEGTRVGGALAVGRSEDLEHAGRLLADGTELGDRVDALADGDLASL